MFDRKVISGAKVMLLAEFSPAAFQFYPCGPNPLPRLSKPPAAAAPSHYQPDRFAGRAAGYYKLVWGVDSLSVSGRNRARSFDLHSVCWMPIKLR